MKPPNGDVGHREVVKGESPEHFSELLEDVVAAARVGNLGVAFQAARMIAEVSLARAILQNERTAEVSSAVPWGQSDRRYSPVWPCGAETGLDSGEPRCRSQIDKSTMAPTARNSLCQFWRD